MTRRHTETVMTMTEQDRFSADSWDERYTGSRTVWSGQPNAQLVAEVDGLAPGRALDLGAGEGADACWLAARGWTVDAVDFSQAALDKTDAHVAELGLVGKVRTRRRDLREWAPPAGTYHLVVAHFLHLDPEALPGVLARSAAATAPGGTFLVVAHHPDDATKDVRRPPAEVLYGPEQVLEVLDDGWQVDVAEARPRQGTDTDGHPVTVHDTVVRAHRPL